MPQITISKAIKAPIERIYKSYLDPKDNLRWNTAGFGWTTGLVNIDPKVGGKWESEYKSPDGKDDFIFGGIYTEIIENKKIAYVMPGNQDQYTQGRYAEVNFEKLDDNKTKLTIIFDAEDENPIEQQQFGWMSILENFTKFVEQKADFKNSVIQKSIEIEAPASKVWKALLDQENYKLWTAPFCEGGYFEGEIKYNEKIKFLSPDQSGLSSLVKVCIPYFQISFEHLGAVKNGIEEFEDVSFQGWKGARETYTLFEKDGVTTLDIYQDMSLKEAKFFDKKWDEALVIVKEISEG